jgi:transcriptional regulator with XRE-family HTH domain
VAGDPLALTGRCPLHKLTEIQGIGPFIRRRRDELDLSLRELAKKLDCSPAFISDVELGRRHPSEKVLSEIARILKVGVDELRKLGVRPPIEEIKRAAQDDPTFALAFRTMLDKKLCAPSHASAASAMRFIFFLQCQLRSLFIAAGNFFPRSIPNSWSTTTTSVCAALSR